MQPPKIGPGYRVLPNHALIKGGTIVSRPFALDGTTIQPAAGHTAIVALDATSPVDPIVRYYTSETLGTGVARIRYCLSKAGIPDRYATLTAANRYSNSVSQSQRGHTFHGGPDILFVTCQTGTIEIEAVDFVPARSLSSLRIRRGTDDNLPTKMIRSELSGITLAGVPLHGGGWNQAVYHLNPFGGTDDDGTNEPWRIDYDVTLGATGTQAVGVSSSTVTDTTAFGISTGYALRRPSGSADLTIRTFATGGTITDVTVTGVFTASAAFSVILSLAHDGTSLQAYVNGAAAGASFAPAWSQSNVAAYVASGSIMQIRACTIQAGAESI